MSTTPLDLVRERIVARLEEARRSAMLSHLGMWLGVLDECQPWNAPAGLRQYRTVAEAAIVYASGEDLSAKRYFEEGVEWLQHRRFFVPGQPKILEADPLACVALSAGIRAHGSVVAQKWLAEIVEQAIDSEQDRQRIDLFKLAHAVGDDDDLTWNALSPILAVACAHKLQRRVDPEEHQRAFEVIMSPDGPDVEWAIFYESALRAIFAMEATIDLAQPTVDQVVKLLKGVPAALKRWPWEDKPKTQHKDVTSQHWDIQHEYHVQSLTWAVLRPVFPGLEDEENLPSLGHKHPRADLLVPALRLIIEVKYLREATQAARAKLIEEIAADTAIYRTPDSGYDTIIALIWDSTGSIHHHAEVETGIRKLQGVVEAVIISRPGEWK